jgi:hypothetical protein
MFAHRPKGAKVAFGHNLASSQGQTSDSELYLDSDVCHAQPMTYLSSRTAKRGIAFAAMAGSLVLACGSRGPLDGTPYPELGASSGVTSSTSSSTSGGTSSSGNNSTSGEPRVDGGGPRRDGGSSGSGIVQCLSCVNTSCRDELSGCLMDRDCSAALQCTLSTCLGGGAGGMVDLQCAFACAKGDIGVVQKLAGAAQCPLQNCPNECMQPARP